MTYPSGKGEDIEMTELGTRKNISDQEGSAAWVEWAERPAAPFSGGCGVGE